MLADVAETVDVVEVVVVTDGVAGAGVAVVVELVVPEAAAAAYENEPKLDARELELIGRPAMGTETGGPGQDGVFEVDVEVDERRTLAYGMVGSVRCDDMIGYSLVWSGSTKRSGC